MRMLILGVLIQLVISNVYGLSQKALDDKITSLPDAPSVDFDQYAGYITLDNTTSKSLFYWFQESSVGAATSPIVLWTNGGPGCSGLAGALIEQGAFRIMQSGDLILNEGRWNQIANMLFIEQPIGVGFSYSDDENDYNVGDNQAAADMFTMIVNFLAEFNDYKFNDFYIASESYGGHYMPMLAKYIVEHNGDALNNSINFKGFLVGNPLTDMVENAKGMYDTWYGHQMISYPLWHEWFTACDDGENQNDTCNGLMNAMADQVSDVYYYGLDWPVCNDGSNLYSFKMQQWFMDKVIDKAFGRKMPFAKFDHSDDHSDHFKKQRMRQINRIKNKSKGKEGKEKDSKVMKKLTADGDTDDTMEYDIYDACQVDYMTEYLNRADVQSAIHAKAGTDWELCSNVTNYNESDISNPMEPYYKFLIDGGYDLHIMIFSGDDDSVCGTLGTQSWIWDLGYPVETKWTDWTVNDGQIGGYYVKFANNATGGTAFSFVTVHSAGHQLSWYKPLISFQMFTNYMEGNF